MQHNTSRTQLFGGRFTLHSQQSTFVDTLHFSSSGDSSIMSSHHGIPATNMVPEHQWLDIGRWSFDLFESKDLWFFPGRNGCYVFPVAGFRAETSYGPKWWEKDRSQGGEKKGGGMSEPPSSPENPCMVCSSHPIIRSSLFQTSQGEDWALNLRVVGPWASWPGVGRFEPLASPNTGGQRHKMFF